MTVAQAAAHARFVVLVVGAGKVGTALHAALISAGLSASLVSARAVLSKSPRARAALRAKASLCVLAVRDAQIPEVAAALTDSVPRSLPLVHTAGALGPEALEAVAARGFATGQMHPLLSFVSGRRPRFEGATLLVSGHAAAVKAVRRLARALGLVPRFLPGLSRPLYHAAASLLANGTAALAEASIRLFESEGITRRQAVAMAGPLLANVVENLLELGLPEALSGPIRRGDVRTFDAHWAAISKKAPPIRALFIASVAMQIDMARVIGEAPPSALRTLRARVTTLGASERRRQSPSTPQIKKAQTISKPRKTRPKP